MTGHLCAPAKGFSEPSLSLLYSLHISQHLLDLLVTSIVIVKQELLLNKSNGLFIDLLWSVLFNILLCQEKPRGGSDTIYTSLEYTQTRGKSTPPFSLIGLLHVYIGQTVLNANWIHDAGCNQERKLYDGLICRTCFFIFCEQNCEKEN